MEGRQLVAGSQVDWALLVEGVSSARLEAHRLRHLLNRAMALVQNSEKRDHIYQVAGDVVLGIPKRLDKLDSDLDRTLLALTGMGKDFLRARMTIEDKTLLDEASTSAPAMSVKQSSAARIARRCLQEGSL